MDLYNQTYWKRHADGELLRYIGLDAVLINIQPRSLFCFLSQEDKQQFLGYCLIKGLTVEAACSKYPVQPKNTKDHTCFITPYDQQGMTFCRFIQNKPGDVYVPNPNWLIV